MVPEVGQQLSCDFTALRCKEASGGAMGNQVVAGRPVKRSGVLILPGSLGIERRSRHAYQRLPAPRRTAASSPSQRSRPRRSVLRHQNRRGDARYLHRTLLSTSFFRLHFLACPAALRARQCSRVEWPKPAVRVLRLKAAGPGALSASIATQIDQVCITHPSSLLDRLNRARAADSHSCLVPPRHRLHAADAIAPSPPRPAGPRLCATRRGSISQPPLVVSHFECSLIDSRQRASGMVSAFCGTIERRRQRLRFVRRQDLAAHDPQACMPRWAGSDTSHLRCA